jgi:hypothetical protein
VYIWISDLSGFPIVVSSWIVEWSGFQTPFENRSGFQMVKLVSTFYIKVRISLFIKWYRLDFLFYKRTPKSLVYRCFQYLNIRYSDPNSTHDNKMAVCSHLFSIFWSLFFNLKRSSICENEIKGATYTILVNLIYEFSLFAVIFISLPLRPLFDIFKLKKGQKSCWRDIMQCVSHELRHNLLQKMFLPGPNVLRRINLQFLKGTSNLFYPTRQTSTSRINRMYFSLMLYISM